MRHIPKIVKKISYFSLKTNPFLRTWFAFKNFRHHTSKNPNHYYKEPRALTVRTIGTFYLSASFIKRTFNDLDIITSFEDNAKL